MIDFTNLLLGDPEYDGLLVRVFSIRDELFDLRMARLVFDPALLHHVEQPETPAAVTIRESLELELALKQEALKRRTEELQRASDAAYDAAIMAHVEACRKAGVLIVN